VTSITLFAKNLHFPDLKTSTVTARNRWRIRKIEDITLSSKEGGAVSRRGGHRAEKSPAEAGPR
jgi:hypothetical protein